MKNILNIPTSFERRWNEGNEGRGWVKDNRFDEALSRFIANEVLEEIDDLGDEVYTRHCLYCCASAPFDKLCFDKNELEKVFESAKAGDYILVWSLSETPSYYEFPCPDKDGLFPTKGAY